MRTLILKGIPYELELADFTQSGHRRHNLAYICPRCLAQWAFIIDGKEDPLHTLFGVPCDSCGPTVLHSVPGSLLDRWTGFGSGIDEELLEALPRELLIRELELHLKAYDNDTSRQDTELDSSSSYIQKAAP